MDRYKALDRCTAGLAAASTSFWLFNYSLGVALRSIEGVIDPLGFPSRFPALPTFSRESYHARGGSLAPLDFLLHSVDSPLALRFSRTAYIALEAVPSLRS